MSKPKVDERADLFSKPRILISMSKQIGQGLKALGTKGRTSRLLESRILNTVKYYSRLTVRQLYYVLISKYRYAPSRKFYKVLNYHLVKMRRCDPKLNAKFVDPTRQFIGAPMSYHEIELWVEKDSVRNFVDDLAAKYRLSIQVLRGFASLSMYRIALLRAAERGVKRILYLGDFDPSGLLIDRVAEREMAIEVKRIALTLEQIKRYRPPSLPVNRRDSRAEDYMKKYGDRCWELEAIRPRTLLRLVKEKLAENVPYEYLVEADARERAAQVAKPIIERLTLGIEKEVLRLMEAGAKEKDISKILVSKYGLDTGTLRGGTGNGPKVS